MSWLIFYMIVAYCILLTPSGTTLGNGNGPLMIEYPTPGPTVAPTQYPTSSNLLCSLGWNDDIDNDIFAWNVINGNWSYNKNDCSIQVYDYNYDTGSRQPNIMWFGNNNGKNAYNEYFGYSLSNYSSFAFQVTMELMSNTIGAGIFIRASNVSSDIHGGYYYYISLYPNDDTIVFGRMENSWTVIETKSVPIEPNVVYTLRVEARESTYQVYLDNTLKMSDIEAPMYGSGTIGLRTWASPAIYYQISYSPLRL